MQEEEDSEGCTAQRHLGIPRARVGVSAAFAALRGRR
jgi:hypothetical protein